MGDYVSIADSAIPGAVRKGDWDASATINHTGGFKKFDNAWKSSNGLTFTLVDLVSKGGTYLMNVGATAEGIIPRPIPSILKSVGDWLKVNGEAIYGAGPSPFGDEFSRGNDETSPPRSAQPVSPSSITWRCTTKHTLGDLDLKGRIPWGERPPTVPPARSPSTECAICRKAGKPCDLVRHLIQFERTVRPLEYGNEELSRLMAMAARARVRCVIVLETQPN